MTNVWTSSTLRITTTELYVHRCSDAVNFPLPKPKPWWRPNGKAPWSRDGFTYITSILTKIAFFFFAKHFTLQKQLKPFSNSFDKVVEHFRFSWKKISLFHTMSDVRPLFRPFRTLLWRCWYSETGFMPESCHGN